MITNDFILVKFWKNLPYFIRKSLIHRRLPLALPGKSLVLQENFSPIPRTVCAKASQLFAELCWQGNMS